MSMSFLVKPSNCHHLSSLTAMAMSSTFCPHIPNHLRSIPICSSPTKPISLSLKAFSSQPSNASSTEECKGYNFFPVYDMTKFQQNVILKKKKKVPTECCRITDELPARVGFLGLGIMGSPMAQNLIKSGCDVTVWNRTKSKCDPFISLGAKYKPSPAEVAASCDVTFAMLADPESAVDVALGKDGAASGMSTGKGYVDVSTVDGETSKLISGHIKAAGALFLEAPVSGSKKPAEDGQLIFLTAGDKSLYEIAAPLLDVMGKSRFYLGEVGNGAAMKLVVNMIMGSMMASFSEGLVLTEKIGLDPKVLVEVISQGAISSPMYSLKGPSMIKSLYPTAFPLKHQQKDMRLALGLAESVSQSTPLAAAANELYKVAKSHGLSDEDFSAVIEALKQKLKR